MSKITLNGSVLDVREGERLVDVRPAPGTSRRASKRMK